MDTIERKILYYLFLASGLLGVVFSIFLLNLVRNYKRNHRLQKQVTAIELETLEKERNRIKTDLHDDLAPVIVTTRSIISSITVQQGNDLHLKQVALNNLQAIHEKLQAISFNLVPTSLECKGLTSAVNELIRQMQLNTTCSICFIYPHQLHLPSEVQLHVYRIIKEALYNTIRHAAAQHCNVELNIYAGKLNLLVMDDGKGFSFPLPRKSGLNNMALRTNLLKGAFFIDSTPGEGTKIRATIPIP